MRVYYRATTATNIMGRLLRGKGVLAPLGMALAAAALAILLANLHAPIHYFSAAALLLALAMSLYMYVRSAVSIQCQDDTVHMDCLFFKAAIPFDEIQALHVAFPFTGMQPLIFHTARGKRRFFIAPRADLQARLGLHEFCKYVSRATDFRIRVKGSLHG